MPQMMPLNWILIFMLMFFFIQFMFSLNSSHYMNPKMNHSQNTNSVNFIQLLW